jgi:hypothetical protein
MTPTFPWGDFEAVHTWLDEYKYGSRSLETLNSLHLAASILYAKLSTYVMHTNAAGLEVE